MDVVVLVKIAAYTLAIGYFVNSLVKSLNDIENRNKKGKDD